MQQRPTATFPSRTYLAVTTVLAVVGLGAAFAALVHPLVGVLAMLPLLVGLQQVGIRRRVSRQARAATKDR